MTSRETLQDKIARRIETSKAEVFMRRDFEDLAGYDQVGRALRQLILKEKIIKIGTGFYAKAGVSPLSNRPVPRKGLRVLAIEALKKLKVEVTPSTYDQAYNEGRTTQIPTGRVIGVKSRINRKIGYQGKYITFERTSRS